MYEDHWERILEAWRDKLEASLDLSNAMRIHLVAEEKEKGEIHRFISIDDNRPSAEIVVARMINQLAQVKLAAQDPTRIQITAVKWVKRSAVPDDFSAIPRQDEALE